jgi:galactose mutarotase-like enzyme
MATIENEYLKIEVNAKGAELTRIFSKQSSLEFLWKGDPAFWAKHSPILFPIVGTLKNDRYYFENKAYTLTRHGFARDMAFELTSQDNNSLTFRLASDAGTQANYPFEFLLEVKYAIEGNKLTVHYQVTNTGNREMYFSIGGHPAFSVPMDNQSAFEDYFIEFAEKETAGRWPISHEGLIEALPLPLLNDTSVLPFTRELFSRDALVFKYLQSTSLKLRSHTSSHGLEFHFEGFPFLGLWSGKNGDFVCIEPWCGIADSVASHQQLVEKEGITMTSPGQLFNRQWSVEIY